MTHLRTVLLAPLILLLFASNGGCSCDEGLPPADQTYTVRGLLRHVPSPGEGHRQLVIEHEAIDDFVDREGDVVGMNAMTMSFDPAEDLELGAVSTGDRVQFTFEVRWESKPMLRVTRLEPLPPDTELRLGDRARPPE